jgi:hypothetical protein
MWVAYVLVYVFVGACLRFCIMRVCVCRCTGALAQLRHVRPGSYVCVCVYCCACMALVGMHVYVSALVSARAGVYALLCGCASCMQRVVPYAALLTNVAAAAAAAVG